jgi:hypothetical protein
MMHGEISDELMIDIGGSERSSTYFVVKHFAANKALFQF